MGGAGRLDGAKAMPLSVLHFTFEHHAWWGGRIVFLNILIKKLD